MLKFILSLFVLLQAPLALGFEGISFATAIMGLTNSTQQGGQGAEGSTILTQTDMSYNGTWWGAGVFFQFDKHGESETDTGLGPRLEARLDPFFVDIGYAVMMNRSFTDRAVAEQTGKSLTLGLGARFDASVAGVFYQFSYKLRTQSITEQDDVELDEPITQTDGYPLFGLGVHF